MGFLLATTCVHHLAPFRDSLLGEAAFQSCHSPALTPLLQGPQEGCVCPGHRIRSLMAPVSSCPHRPVCW